MESENVDQQSNKYEFERFSGGETTSVRSIGLSFYVIFDLRRNLASYL
jgi:hypothetical protein